MKEARGLGIGRLLLENVLKTASSHGFRQVFLYACNGHERALQIYQKVGFVNVSKSLVVNAARWLTPFHGYYLYKLVLKLPYELISHQ